MIKNKKALEFSFNWLFAIIVGAVVIFLAIYISSQYIKTARIEQDTKLGKELGIILTPIETDLEASKITKISMPQETRIYNECQETGTFGLQKISTATKSLNDKWDQQGLASSFSNKYLFSEKIIEGKDYTVFSKSLEMPFKIADIMYIWPTKEEFCFVNPPRLIEEEMQDLQTNVNVTSSASECPREAKKVCFTTSGCDIDVSLDASGKIKGSLKKKLSNRVYFEGSIFLYASIFSDPEIYECQLKRLMKRASELSLLYYSKSLFLTPKGCSSNLEIDLADYANQTLSLNNSLQLRDIFLSSEIIRRKNNDLSCKLF